MTVTVLDTTFGAGAVAFDQGSTDVGLQAFRQLLAAAAVTYFEQH